MSKENIVYAFSEAEYIKYMNKLHLEQQAITNLLFDEPSSLEDTHIRALLCEQYAACHYLDVLLEQLEDSFVVKDEMFYLGDSQELMFTLLLATLAKVKEELLQSAVSLSYH